MGSLNALRREPLQDSKAVSTFEWQSTNASQNCAI